MIFKKNGNSRIVYTVGAPVLREIAAPVAVVDDQIRQLAADMIDAMGYFNGIGLAAPQYGKSLRLVVIDVPQESNTGSPGEVLLLPKMPLVLVNPEIVMSSENSSSREEGCLSVPGRSGIVTRPMHVTVRALNRHGEVVDYTGSGLLERAFCHELDHLDGKLFIDHAEMID